MTTKPIRFYTARGEHGFLSNLYESRVTLDGISFTTAEHAYQWAKAKDPAVGEWIASAPRGRHAALAGHHLSTYDVVPDWAETKTERMTAVVEAKFRQNPALRLLLLATGDARLEEDGPDGTWGIGKNGNGQNRLGVILMGVRERLQDGEP